MAMDLIVTFDTEDYFHPAAAGKDDILLRAANIVAEAGVPGTFLVIARRAASLKDRGRHDVLDAIRRCGVGVHCLGHQAPREFVVAAESDWATGLDKVRRMEREAYRIVAECFDTQPVALSGHTFSGPPQSYVVARDLGIPYIYGHAAAPPLFGLSRYCGGLIYPIAAPVIDPGVPLPNFTWFDESLPNAVAFEKRLAMFNEHVDRCIAAGHPLMLLHPLHPQKFYNRSWIDNYMVRNGRNLPPESWATGPQPPLRTPGEVEIALHHFRQLMQAVARDQRLNLITIPQMAARYGQVPSRLTAFDLATAAQKVIQAGEVVIAGRFSPAETLLGWAAALTASATLPESVERIDALGPMQDPLIMPEMPGTIAWDDLRAMARQLLEQTRAAGHLPANLPAASGQQVGLGVLYHALAEAYLHLFSTGQALPAVELVSFPRQPAIGPGIGTRYLEAAENGLVAPDLNVNGLYRSPKLQSWTIAASWFAQEA